MKRLIKYFIILLLAGGFVYRLFFYVDFKNDCFITIKPSFTEFSTGNIKEAIKIMKRGTPEEYKKFCRHVKAINPNLACGGLGGGCYYHSNKEKKEIDISTAYGGFLGQTAAIIAHETCHAIQSQEGRNLNETECYHIDDVVLKKLVEL